MIIDSGTSIKILDETSFQKFKPYPNIELATTKIYPYQAKTPLKLKGIIKAIITANNVTLPIVKFYIVKGHQGSLMGKETAEALDILRVGPPVHTAVTNAITTNVPPSTQNVVNNYQSVFEGIGLLKNFPTKTSH